MWSFEPSWRQSMFGEPSLPMRSLRANISSTVARSPTIAPILEGGAIFTLAAITSNASRQLAGLSLPPART